MICQNCHINTANIKITQVFMNERHDIFLCIDCAKKFGLDDPFSELPPEFEKFLRNLPAMSADKESDEPNITCSCCGHDYNSFEQSGLVGCPVCYSEFGERMKTMLRRYHGTTRHAKAKKSILVELLSDDKLSTLKNKLNSALEREDFEAAAILRDEISALKKIKRKKV